MCFICMCTCLCACTCLCVLSVHMCVPVFGGQKQTLGLRLYHFYLSFEVKSLTVPGAHQSSKDDWPTFTRVLVSQLLQCCGHRSWRSLSTHVFLAKEVLDSSAILSGPEHLILHCSIPHHWDFQKSMFKYSGMPIF